MLSTICVAVLMIFTGAAFYPVGWYAEEVRDACGPQADVYRIGNVRFLGQSPVWDHLSNQVNIKLRVKCWPCHYAHVKANQNP